MWRDQIRGIVKCVVHRVEMRIRDWTRPVAGIFLGVVSDLMRPRTELTIENALLRQQLIVLRRQVSRVRLTALDRVRMVVLARLARSLQDALLIVKPETVLRWHRRGFRLFWRRKSKAKRRQLRIRGEVADLIREMASTNRLWGAERIRGELLKLGIRLSKRSIQRYLSLPTVMTHVFSRS